MVDQPKLLAEWFWTDRWMGSSGFLLAMEPRGLYREMLTQAWRRGARLPTDHEEIRRAVGCTLPEWRRCWPKVEKFWRVDGDSLVNDTQLEVYAEAQGVKQRAHERGVKGAQARAQALAQAKDKQPLKVKPPSPSPSPSPSVSFGNTNLREFPVAEKTTDELAERAGKFVRETYPALYAKHRRGARYISKPNLDYLEALELCRVWDDARLEKIATIFLLTDHEFAEKGSRTMAQFRSLASWCDGRLAEAGIA